MDVPTIRPPALRLGDTIGIVAPAGPLQHKEAFHQGVATLERLGFRVRYDERIFQSRRYLAGDDVSRAEELMRYFEDPHIQGVLALRGGYGCARLLHLLDERRLRSHCKVFMGFSDLTTLHLLFCRHFGWITIHGPMASSPTLGNAESGIEEHLMSLWTDPEYRPMLSFPELETWREGTVEGQLTGGCLSLVRMLTQLRLAGKLDALKGALLGSFHQCDPSEGGYTVEDILREMLDPLQVPILARFPAGHGSRNWPLPFAVRVRLDATRRRLEILEPAVRRQ
ncbi:MAG: hypothetical protein DMG10_09370 [Acidobacteria bacterium]|nr:MAG: hypothetical protein DMG10_09370 [Acidobacteriota bacterium]